MLLFLSHSHLILCPPLFAASGIHAFFLTSFTILLFLFLSFTTFLSFLYCFLSLHFPLYSQLLPLSLCLWHFANKRTVWKMAWSGSFSYRFPFLCISLLCGDKRSSEWPRLGPLCLSTFDEAHSLGKISHFKAPFVSFLPFSASFSLSFLQVYLRVSVFPSFPCCSTGHAVVPVLSKSYVLRFYDLLTRRSYSF